MAIARIDPPTPTAPVSSADYVAILNALAVAQQGYVDPFPFIGSTIKAGRVFGIGGVLYQSTTDTAITGTASDYVKITASGASATAAFIANLTNVTWNNAYGAYYHSDGSLVVFDEAKALYAGVISTPYTLHGKLAYLQTLTVNTLNASRVVTKQLGAGSSAGGSNALALGNSAAAAAVGSISIGDAAGALGAGDYSVQIGPAADAVGDGGAVAIGQNARAAGNGQVSIGPGAGLGKTRAGAVNINDTHAPVAGFALSGRVLCGTLNEVRAALTSLYTPYEGEQVAVIFNTAGPYTADIRTRTGYMQYSLGVWKVYDNGVDYTSEAYTIMVFRIT